MTRNRQDALCFPWSLLVTKTHEISHFRSCNLTAKFSAKKRWTEHFVKYSYNFFHLHDLSCVARVSAETPTQTHTISTWFLVIVVVESTSVFFTVVGATSCCFATGHIENHSVCRGHRCKPLWEKRKQDRRRSSKIWKLSTNNTFSKWPLAQIFGSLFLISLYFPFTDSKLNKGCSKDTEGGGREKKNAEPNV